MNYNPNRRVVRQASVTPDQLIVQGGNVLTPTNSVQLIQVPQNPTPSLQQGHPQLQQQLSSGTGSPFTSLPIGTVISVQSQPQIQAMQQQQQPPAPLPLMEDLNGPVTLLSEISDIMRSFGDSDQPSIDSVKLVQQILQQQLKGIFYEASLVALKSKDQPCPTQADFEFLMRKCPVKIARMRKHLKDMRILKKFLSIKTGRPQDFAEDLEKPDSGDELPIDLPELYDEERTRRLFRADRISQILNGQQYLDFNEARKTSFYCRHGEKIKNKFHRFLDLPTNLQIPTQTMNILAYFAHETIAVLVDYAILSRLNSENRITDPFSRVTSTGASPAMLNICPEVTQGRGQEVVRPISVSEIREAVRRFHQMANKKVGFYRSSCDPNTSRTFLAM